MCLTFQATRPLHLGFPNLVLSQLLASQEMINYWAHIPVLLWKSQERSRAGQGSTAQEEGQG